MNFRVNPIMRQSAVNEVSSKSSPVISKELPQEISNGTVSANITRPMKPEADPDLIKLLQRFHIKSSSFDWSMEVRKSTPRFSVYDVQFPSPCHSSVEENNTVFGEYFVSSGVYENPVVIVLHMIDGKFIASRLLCQSLVKKGVNAFLLKMPFYDQRRPPGISRFNKIMETPESLTTNVFEQVVKEVRRTARWLKGRPEVDETKICISGISLGGFIAGTAAGVDGLFPKMALLLAGGDLPTVFSGDSREVAMLRSGMDRHNWSTQQIARQLVPVDPITYVKRADETKVLMINAEVDNIVPLKCAQKLAEGYQAELHILPCDHYGIVRQIPSIMKQIASHFTTW